MTIERDDAIFYTGIFLGMFAAAFASFLEPIGSFDLIIIISQISLMMSLLILWIVWARVR